MAQHDQVIDNNTGLGFRTDVNAALAALFSTSSGATAPTVTSAGQLWFDTTLGMLKIRNAGNTAWIAIYSPSAVGMSTGLRASPDRWVVNDAADLTGNDLFWVLDTSGNVVAREKITLIEVDGSARGMWQVGIGADAGTMYNYVYDAAGTEVNRTWLQAAGLNLKAGGLRFHTAAVLRGNLFADMAGATGRLTLESYTNASVIDGSAILTSSGLALNLAGNFYISRSGFVRALYGWDATGGAQIRANDGTGATIGEIDVNASGASLLYGNYRLVTSGGALRAHISADRVGAAGSMTFESVNNAAAADGAMVLHSGGLALSLAGDFYIYRSGFTRANFGWDVTNGAYVKARDGAGAVIGEMNLAATGITLKQGAYRLMTGTTVRASYGAELSTANGRLDLNSYTSAGVLDGQAQLSAAGLFLPLSGDFIIYRGGFARANFGWNTTYGAYHINRDAAGAITGQLDVRALMAVINGATGSISEFRAEDAAHVKRGAVEVDIGATNANIHLASYDNAGAAIAKVIVRPTGIFATYTAVADKQLFDTGWFPSQASTAGVTDFPLGHTLMVAVGNGSEVNRNVSAVVRLTDAGMNTYAITGTNTVLSGTWRSCGLSQVAGAGSNWYGMFRRVA